MPTPASGTRCLPPPRREDKRKKEEAMTTSRAITHMLPSQPRREPIIPQAPIDFSEITRSPVQYELYNPDPDNEVHADFNGEPYTFPRAGEKHVGVNPYTLQKEEYPEPGVCPIRDDLRRREHPVTAKDIVKFFCGEDGRSGVVGVLGIRPLFGDPKRDEAVKAEAFAALVARRDEETAIAIQNHEMAVAAAREAGDAPPRPSMQVLHAYDWRDLRETEQMVRVSCPICNHGFREESEMYAHVVARHKKHPFALQAAEFLKLDGSAGNRPEYEPPNRGGVRDPENIDATAAVSGAAAAAKELGVTLAPTSTNPTPTAPTAPAAPAVQRPTIPGGKAR